MAQQKQNVILKPIRYRRQDDDGLKEFVQQEAMELSEYQGFSMVTCQATQTNKLRDIVNRWGYVVSEVFST